MYKNIDDIRRYRQEHYQKNKQYYKEKARRNDKKRREATRKFVRDEKDIPCSDCGNKFPPYVMQYDHIGDDKEFDLASAAGQGWSMKRIKAEIAKCEVVCANCHAERTYRRRFEKKLDCVQRSPKQTNQMSMFELLPL